MTPAKGRKARTQVPAAPPAETLTIFRCDGTPVYGDVTDGSNGPWFATYDLAEGWGRRILEAGNWSSFGVVRRTFLVDSCPQVHNELPGGGR